ncbi:MAG: phage tail protein I [Pseudomonadota bacterium]
MAKHQLTVDLPSQQTDLENAVVASFGDLLNTSIPIRELSNPDACPLEFLPHLAWANSVDVWDPEWPEQLKRDVIKASPEVHRLKGTVQAVKASLAGLGVIATVTEWFEQAPAGVPGTFSVEMDFSSEGGRYWLADDFTLLRNAISASKPLSRAYAISVALDLTVTANVGAVLTSEIEINVPAYFLDPEPTNAGAYAGAAMISEIEINVPAYRPDPELSNAQAYAGASMTTLVEVETGP